MQVRDNEYYEGSDKSASVNININPNDSYPVRLTVDEGWYSVGDLKALRSFILKAEKIAKTQQLPQ